MLIHPARQEPLGRVLLESAASGLPLVTTNVGGSAEILSDNGGDNEANLARLLVELPTLPENETASPDNRNVLNQRLADRMSQRILELLRAPDELNQIGKRLRLRAIEGFSIERCASQIDMHYKSLTAEVI